MERLDLGVEHRAALLGRDGLARLAARGAGNRGATLRIVLCEDVRR